MQMSILKSDQECNLSSDAPPKTTNREAPLPASKACRPAAQSKALGERTVFEGLGLAA